MDALIVIGSVVLFLLIIILIVWISNASGKKRAKALNHVASSLNLEFKDIADNSMMALFREFALFSNAVYPLGSGVMVGAFKEIYIIIADYKFRVSGTRLIPAQTIIIINSDSLQLPSFTLQPERLVQKINLAVGYEKIDIDFDSHPDFSKRYLLQGPDEEKIRKFFKPEIIAYFEQHSRLCAEGDGNALLVFKQEHIVPPEEFRSFINKALELYDLLKTRK